MLSLLTKEHRHKVYKQPKMIARSSNNDKQGPPKKHHFTEPRIGYLRVYISLKYVPESHMFFL